MDDCLNNSAIPRPGAEASSASGLRMKSLFEPAEADPTFCLLKWIFLNMTSAHADDSAISLPLDAPLLPREEALLKQINSALRIGALDKAIELLGELLKGRGITRLASKTGLNRSHLYRALHIGGNPSLDSVMRLCEEMNLVIRVVPKT